MESTCERGNESSGSIKCWELPNGCTSCGLSSGTQLHRISWFVITGFMDFVHLPELYMAMKT
jgi:hypothetical protein